MKAKIILNSFAFLLLLSPSISTAKDLPKIAVWDLEPRNTPTTYARELTSILVSEAAKLKMFEVYSQENVRTLAGWTAERMKLGCTDTQCLIALGQMDMAKLISGSVAKIGNRYSVSLNLFDTQNARAENSISKFCTSEDELIELVQVAVRNLLGVFEPPPPPEPKKPPKPQKPPEKEAKPSKPEPSPDLEKSFKDPYTGMEFILVKGGCFDMGDTFGDGKSHERPVHEVCVGDFYLGKYEVTQGQWKMVMNSNPSGFKESDYHPVESVSWNHVQEFIRKLNQKSGKSYRLPTEAEWEFAARSGGKTENWSGTNNDSELPEYSWHSKNSDRRTHPVGQKKPNGLGFYDMSGNVWEWVYDWYDNYRSRSSPENDPRGPGNGEFKLARGGSWDNVSSAVRAATRNGSSPDGRNNCIGFRLGLSSR